MNTYTCDRCGHSVPVAYTRSHRSWHEHTDTEESAA